VDPWIASKEGSLPLGKRHGGPDCPLPAFFERYVPGDDRQELLIPDRLLRRSTHRCTEAGYLVDEAVIKHVVKPGCRSPLHVGPRVDADADERASWCVLTHGDGFGRLHAARRGISGEPVDLDRSQNAARIGKVNDLACAWVCLHQLLVEVTRRQGLEL
jgi:hypothetical protein